MPSIIKGTRLEMLRSSGSIGSQLPFLAAWGISGILAVIIPLLVRNRRINQYNMRYGYNYNYEQQDRQEDYNQDYDLNNCKWYQFSCNSYYGEGDDQGYSPGWFSGWGMTERQREQAMENGDTPRALRFVYAWQIIMFIAILAYGFMTFSKRKSTTGLIGMLLIWANFNFLAMWMLADGSIETVSEDGEEQQTGGFYGQFSVLVFMTNFWYTLFGFIFSIILFVLAKMESKEEQAVAANNEETSSQYRAYSESPKKTTQNEDSDDEFVKVI